MKKEELNKKNMELTEDALDSVVGGARIESEKVYKPDKPCITKNPLGIEPNPSKRPRIK